MRVHLNCGTMCPVSARLVNGRGSLFGVARMVCHCLLVETGDGLVLVDSGLGIDDVRSPRARLGAWFVAMTRARLDEEETAVRSIERLGFSANDVRHVVLTHLDLDHAGGIPDFPKAKVHVFAKEHAAAMQPRTRLESNRYRPAHWAHAPSWVLHDVAGERFMGFDAVHALDEGAHGDTTHDVLLVPLVGHTRGHCGVAVRSDDGWLLHCGDAYFFHGEVHGARRTCPPGLALFESLAEIDRAARLENQARLRGLVAAHEKEITVFCAHDPRELDARRTHGASVEFAHA